MVIDTHHHLWRYNADEFDWITGEMQSLRRDFLPDDLRQQMQQAGVDAAIAVQARQSLEETHWLLEQSAAHPCILGVVGWAPIMADDFADTLQTLRTDKRLLGLRHVVQAEPSGFLARPEFHRGMREITRSGLVYELLVYQHQLEEAIAVVDRHPHQRFVLDHCGKPDIRHDGWKSWNTTIKDLARREHVVCKLSGLVTEADWTRWTEEEITPYLHSVIEAFGADRCMAGSDWPVMLLASSYPKWWCILREAIQNASEGEQAKMLGDTAMNVYGINSRMETTR